MNNGSANIRETEVGSICKFITKNNRKEHKNYEKMVYCKYGNRCFRVLSSPRRTGTICSPGRWLRISKHRRIFCHSNLSVRLEWYSSPPTSRWRRCSAAWKRSAYTASAANCSRAGLCRWNSLQRMKLGLLEELFTGLSFMPDILLLEQKTI